ncbi:MAG: hypothetical protein WC761_01880 [Candidatus Paceibacterota bacterium]|jgi:hypothetical protein
MAPLIILKDWFVKNWLTVVLAIVGIGLAFWFLSGMFKVEGENASLRTMMTEQQERHSQEMTELTDSFERQRVAQQAVDQAFEKRITDLDLRYTEALTQIAQVRRTRQQRLVDNPSELPGAFESVFGIPSRAQQ